jgi:protein arginine kinase activator
MKCQSCGEKEATVHLTDLINNEEKHLCDKCAEEQGAVAPTLSVSSVLSSLIEQQHETEIEDDLKDVTCPMCGTTYEELRKQGKAGCARCYEVFARGFMPFIERIQGSSEHRGKAPRRLDKADTEIRRRLLHCKQRLKIAVMEEDYELAASMRDEIRMIEKQKAGEGKDDVTR